MWKKSEPEYSEPEKPSPATTHSPSFARDHAVIGPSLRINGEVTGEEDLVIQGQVDGKVELQKNSVTIGKNGVIRADIHGKIVTVEGKVTGNLFGHEKVVIRQSGKVRGNITAPRVTLEDGAQFKGSIDMEGRSTEKATPASAVASDKGRESKEEKTDGKPQTGKPGFGVPSTTRT